ncbi:hypothetical protein HYX13_02715, partial [Candidatus Woesearchaeota archaeon]|nr:hypothetical protein [Candidatus Woesearchaeota archaeon]
PEKKQSLQLLGKELLQKNPLEMKKKQLEEMFLKITFMITRNETLLNQSQQIQQKVGILEECPTCVQRVTPEHKQRIFEQEQQKINQAQELLNESQQKYAEIIQQRKETDEVLKYLLQKEYFFNKISIEITNLEEKETKLQQTSVQQEELQQKLSLMYREKLLLKEETYLELEKKLEELRSQMQQLLLKEQKEKQLQELKENAALQERNITEVKEQCQNLELALLTFPEIKENILLLHSHIQQIVQQEKEILLMEREYTTHLQQREKQSQEINKQVTQMQQEKRELLKTQKTYHWLEQFFLPLTTTIEKHILISIHRHFNKLFHEWFSLLIDNEQITARIDDAFTPIIEQDGYEIFFEHLSGGERTSAALAYRLALNRVINDVIHQIKTKELFILDEPTDGFSSEQLDRVREVLQKLQLQQLIIVSHESKIEGFVESVMRVQKEGGESKVVC